MTVTDFIAYVCGPGFVVGAVGSLLSGFLFGPLYEPFLMLSILAVLFALFALPFVVFE